MRGGIKRGAEKLGGGVSSSSSPGASSSSSPGASSSTSGKLPKKARLELLGDTLITYPTRDDPAFQYDATNLVWWLIEAIRDKVTEKVNSITTNEPDFSRAPRPVAGKAAPPEYVDIIIDSGTKLTEFLARFAIKQSAVYRLRFTQCNNATMEIMGTLHGASKHAVNPASPYSIFCGTYEVDIVQHLHELMEEAKKKKATNAQLTLFRDMIRAIKGKSTEILSTSGHSSIAAKCIGVMAGSEGARSVGMLAAAVMALNLLKHGKKDIPTMFIAGGWPAVGKGTEDSLRKIDEASFAKRNNEPAIPLGSADEVFKKFAVLIKDYVENAFQRDEQVSRINKQISDPAKKDAALVAATKGIATPLDKPVQHGVISNAATLEHEAKLLITRKVLVYL